MNEPQKPNCIEWLLLAWALAVFVAAAMIFYNAAAYPRDLDGSYAKSNPELHAWFDHLANKNHGLCCSFADGYTVDDPDVDMAGDHYRVRIEGQWIDVPDEALVTEPNRYGKAVVWPWKDWQGGKVEWRIRCFMPGAGA